eukprot:scaffold80_cov325-Pavlova_lutheri.AAC.10
MLDFSGMNFPVFSRQQDVGCGHGFPGQLRLPCVSSAIPTLPDRARRATSFFLGSETYDEIERHVLQRVLEALDGSATRSKFDTKPMDSWDVTPAQPSPLQLVHERPRQKISIT